MRSKRRTLTYTLWSFVPVVVAAIAVYWLSGRPGLLIGAPLTLPWLAWRYDNQTGTFLPLAVLVVFLFVILALFLLLMAVVFSPHGR